MQIGIPYDQAVNIPLDLAIALLSDERPNNTHQPKPHKNTTESISPNGQTTYIAKYRKHSQKKI
ncbi:hypothetical protein I2F27_11320 [Acinetobacter sp. B5B]|uniref:hypothetical protein n=1 Tax=Acinetobacter baretiae TaxID=2605383 RepID=UPI0018C27C21|nr:hypothetical protein [Acinetobacter baretiae]MBF7683909.1 hypothetical protein [Acinetobacter baretiae]